MDLCGFVPLNNPPVMLGKDIKCVFYTNLFRKRYFRPMVNLHIVLRHGVFAALFIALMAPLSVAGQHRLSTDGPLIVNEAGDAVLLRGDGTWRMDAPRGIHAPNCGFCQCAVRNPNKIEQLIGEEATDDFYTAWLQNHVTKADIDAMNQGFMGSICASADALQLVYPSHRGGACTGRKHLARAWF